MSRKRTHQDAFHEIKDIESKLSAFTVNPITESNLKSCLVRLKKNKNITRLCRKLLYISGLSSPEKNFQFNYSLANYGNLQTNLGQVVSMLYLLYKSPNDCAVFNKPINNSIDFLKLHDTKNDRHDINIHYVHLPYKNKTFVPEINYPTDFKKQINKCSNQGKRFTIVFLTHVWFYFENEDDLKKIITRYLKKTKKTSKQIKLLLDNIHDNEDLVLEKKDFFNFYTKYYPNEMQYHQNCLIIDNKNKSIERFEPHGSDSNYNMEDLDNALKFSLMNTLDINAFAVGKKNPKHPNIPVYISPPDFCPSDSFQVLEDNDALKTQLDFQGYCYIWTIFYMEMRMSQPDVPRDKLISKTIKYFKTQKISLKDYIYDYIYFHSYILNVVEQLLKNFENNYYFKYIPSSYINLVVRTKIKELANIYTKSIFNNDVSIKKSEKTHLSKIKSIIKDNISQIFFTNEEINPNIKREFLIPSDTFHKNKKQKLKGGKKKKQIRKHKGVNQSNGRLKKGYKYSGKKSKSGLPQIIKIKKHKKQNKKQKGGVLKFKQKGPSEKKYPKCHDNDRVFRNACPIVKMPYCCPSFTPASGYCRPDHDSCMKTGISASKRKGNVSPKQLKELRKNMAIHKRGRFTVSISSDEDKPKLNRQNASDFLERMIAEDKEKKSINNRGSHIRKNLKSKREDMKSKPKGFMGSKSKKTSRFTRT